MTHLCPGRLNSSQSSNLDGVQLGQPVGLFEMGKGDQTAQQADQQDKGQDTQGAGFFHYRDLGLTGGNGGMVK